MQRSSGRIRTTRLRPSNGLTYQCAKPGTTWHGMGGDAAPCSVMTMGTSMSRQPSRSGLLRQKSPHSPPGSLTLSVPGVFSAIRQGAFHEIAGSVLR